jgi:hypothetical protein
LRELESLGELKKVKWGQKGGFKLIRIKTNDNNKINIKETTILDNSVLRKKREEEDFETSWYAEVIPFNLPGSLSLLGVT